MSVYTAVDEMELVLHVIVAKGTSGARGSKGTNAGAERKGVEIEAVVERTLTRGKKGRKGSLPDCGGNRVVTKEGPRGPVDGGERTE